MIQITLAQALMLYSAILGLLALALWVYADLAARLSHRVLAKQSLWRCVFCGYTYLDEGAEKLSKCPRCDSFNSLDDKHAKLVRPKRHAAAKDALPEEASHTRRNPSRGKRTGQRRRGPRRRGR